MSDKLKTYEKKYEELETIVKALEGESLPLHEMVEQYKQGLSLIKECSEVLADTEAKMEQLIEEIKVSDNL